MLAEVLAEAGPQHLVQACYESLTTERRRMLLVYSVTSVERVLGRLATRLRDWNRAFEHYESALDELRAGGARYELAIALQNYAGARRLRRRRGDLVKASALESRASEILSDLQLTHTSTDSVPAEQPGNLFALSTRELEVLELVALGLRNREIAGRLALSERTVQRHLENIFGKMDVEGRTEAVVRAVERQLISPGIRKGLSGVVADQ
jgi:ATP/maltotriose-dependent transcriptional regulator MalT